MHKNLMSTDKFQ